MKTVRLVLIGFGNVGQGFAQILLEHVDDYATRFGLRFAIVAVSDLLKGSVYDPAGLDPAGLLAAVHDGGSLNHHPAARPGWDASMAIAESGAETVVEISYTDLKTGEPALSYIRQALRLGKHVVTSNKGPVALDYPGLSALAREHGAQLGVEGTVMSGTPALRLGVEALAGAGLRRVQGILNGTTNYILTQMEAGDSYAEALADAQARGYAEADPTGDVEGFDAAGKVAILATVLFDHPLRLDQVRRTGITGLSPADIQAAQAAGERWKLIGSLEVTGEGIQAAVQPQRLPLGHPLAGVSGATNAITYTTDLLGEVTLIGPGAGRVETGYALLGDLLGIYRS